MISGLIGLILVLRGWFSYWIFVRIGNKARPKSTYFSCYSRGLNLKLLDF